MLLPVGYNQAGSDKGGAPYERDNPKSNGRAKSTLPLVEDSYKFYENYDHL